MKIFISTVVIAFVLNCLDQGLGKENKIPEERKLKPQLPPILMGKKPCCPRRNNMLIDLTKRISRGSVQGVSQLKFKSPTSAKVKCGVMADLRVNFQRFSNCLSDWTHCQCVSFPMCGQRLLRIDMFLGKQRKGYMFNVGDSPSNDGWGGDSGHTKHDAEIMGYYPRILGYKSDFCKSQRTQWSNTLLAPGVKRVTMFAGNNYVRIKNDQGFEMKECHECGFALNGQDPNDSANTLYMAFNNMIKGTHRNGYGVCYVRIRWECPDC
ncbi:uncharacterized protein LOC130054845 [Ostrea edulis]|uniref:uncharacterized protein LOC130054845 n=1 Tax=Ostrea edulis TaxID=37623 RepID=UPI0024AEF611|nr:uncharacterized protein LOC130054845 [Ostrea edulis]